jgi:phosphoenolpyruvate carboxykinase (ATP)
VGLDAHGISNLNRVYWNLGTPALYEEAIRRHEGIVAHLGPLVVRTGQHTGRSPNDKFTVQEPSTADNVWWGQGQPPLHAGALRCAAPPAGLLPATEGCLRAGLLGRG